MRAGGCPTRQQKFESAQGNFGLATFYPVKYIEPRIVGMRVCHFDPNASSNARVAYLQPL
jgi:hypothetical protein